MKNTYTFPTGALPEKAQRAAQELISNVGAPETLVAMTILYGMSMAGTLRFDIRLPHGPVRAPAMLMVVIAESGDRKSTVEKLALRPIYELHHELTTVGACQRAESATKGEIDAAVRKRLIADIAKAHTKGEGTECLRAALTLHDKDVLATRHTDGFIVGNTTLPAFLKAVEGEHRIAAILSDEGDAVLNGPLFRDITFLNSAWDNAPVVTLHRAGGNLLAQYPRVSMFVAIQPSIWRKFDTKRGAIALASGFRARVLIGHAESRQGYRFAPSIGLAYPSLDEFHNVLKLQVEPYRRAMLDGTHWRRELLDLSPQAAQLLHLATQGLEPLLAPGEALHHCRDYASKFGEHVCRIAASMHPFNATTSASANLIAPDTVERAIAIAQWFGAELMHVYNPAGPLSALADEAEKLLQYIAQRYWVINAPARLAEIVRNGPVRPKSRIVECADYLQAAGSMQIVTDRRLGVVFNPPGQRCVYMPLAYATATL